MADSTAVKEGFKAPPRTVSAGPTTSGGNTTTKFAPQHAVFAQFRPVGGGSPSSAAAGSPSADPGKPVPSRSPPRETSPAPKDGGKSPPPPRGSAAAAAPESPAGSPAVLVPHHRPPTPPPKATPPPPPPVGVKQHYTLADMQRIKDALPQGKFLSDRVKSLASKLWPEGAKERPTDLWSRDNIFSDSVSKVKQRTLTMMVRGILTRLTPENYPVMKLQLGELPIRQSTDEEVTEVVNMMYSKAVRPEDELYTELYAKLMADLVQFTGVEGVGKTIRRAIIDKCQAQFEEPYALRDEDMYDAAGNTLPDDEISEKRHILKVKLKCNIKFLGHLFVSGMVNEKVVNFVLYHLLYGKDTEGHVRRKRKPEEYELEMFCELLKKVVPKLSQKTLTEYVGDYMKSIRGLITSGTTSQRMKFILMDLIEQQDNGWVDKRKKFNDGPMTLEELDRKESEDRARQQAEVEKMISSGKFQRHGVVKRPVAEPASPATPAAPLPAKDEVYKLIEDYKASSNQQELEQFFKNLPSNLRAEYLQHWIQRVLRVAKKEDERMLVGEVMAVLNDANVIGIQDCQRVMVGIVRKIVDEQLWEDNTRIFACWAAVIATAQDRTRARLVSSELHTTLLDCMINARPQPDTENIIKMIQHVTETKPKDATEKELPKRFRLLPSVLAFIRVADEDDDDVNNDSFAAASPTSAASAVDEDDLLQLLLQSETSLQDDIELKLFSCLYEGYNGAKLKDIVTRHPNRTDPSFVLKVACAIFTYCRCDETKTELERCRDVLAAVSKSRENQGLILIEAYLSWRDLGRSPKAGFEMFASYCRTVLKFEFQAYKMLRDYLVGDREALAETAFVLSFDASRHH